MIATRILVAEDHTMVYQGISNMLAGEYQSAFKGRGMEFAEVRAYVPGDDVRSIDWRATARRRDLVVRRLDLEFVPSHANFILTRVGDGARVFNELQRQGVIVRPMAGYRLPEWIRISIGTAAENTRCLAALAKALGR